MLLELHVACHNSIQKAAVGLVQPTANLQGVAFTKSEANMEKDNVVDWALRLTDPPPATRERVMKGESAIMEDLVPLSSIPTNRLFFFSNHCLGPMRGVV